MLDAGVRMVAHAEEFLYAHATSSLDPADIAYAGEIATRNGAWVTATVSTYEGIRALFDANRNGEDVAAQLDATAGVRYLPLARRNQWLVSQANNYTSTADISAQLEFQLQMMRDFERAGVGLLLGTDSPVIPGLVPGFALLREMALLRGAGIPAEAVLRAGTASAGDFIAATVGGRGFGRIAPGLRADLVLLDDDPVARPETLEDPAGTMAAGRWYPRDTLTTWLAELAGN